MRYRETTVLAEESFTAAGTKTIDITLTDMISRFLIIAKCTKSKNAMDDHPAADLTKIELVDGSDVLFSMSGKECQGLNTYEMGKAPGNELSCYGGVDTHAQFFINFGRYLYDPQLAFDPTKFKNPQLKLSHNYRVSDIGATALKLSVYADVFDELKPVPSGFLMSKTYYSYVCGVENSYEYIDMPTDFPLRKLILRPYRYYYEPWLQIKEIRLDEDNLKRIPYDITDLEAWLYKKRSNYPLVHEKLDTTYDVGTTYRYVMPTDYFQYIYAVTGAVQTGYHTGYLKGGRIGYVQGAAGQELHGAVLGNYPHFCIELPFGKPDLIEDWYDVTKVGTLTLRLRAGASGTSGNVDVVTQQFRRV